MKLLPLASRDRVATRRHQLQLLVGAAVAEDPDQMGGAAIVASWDSMGCEFRIINRMCEPQDEFHNSNSSSELVGFISGQSVDNYCSSLEVHGRWPYTRMHINFKRKHKPVWNNTNYSCLVLG